MVWPVASPRSTGPPRPWPSGADGIPEPCARVGAAAQAALDSDLLHSQSPHLFVLCRGVAGRWFASTVSVVLGISLECANAALVTRFWARALCTELGTGDPMVLHSGSLRLTFLETKEGKYVRNRVRLHLVTHDFEFETARLLSLGAVRLTDVARGGRRWTTFADVEGNEFDLIDGESR
ncbi:VOC family protein [Kutzneria sp. NPDC052558]|uniref:VOC family protein n=1 Tax=Kutzneria sp. NPDC052558 TaxID=3364121 RepID=UPI0037C63717